ncbi:hypothetical protein C4D60_Mb07t18560 [Musa balbisiana]|uniref:NAD(P)-binding domain-containing protein n=1 Tax=Musa balbisiana TaxID=52838 RepID=A0A4S8JGI8_MUSBA|nr:hypothetical protein C4D60_Mb07t18560 [Musa balbisiana]
MAQPCSPRYGRATAPLHRRTNDEMVLRSISSYLLKSDDSTKKGIACVSLGREIRERDLIEMEKTSTVCVTGGSGYIGSWLVKKLLQRGYHVHATVRNSGISTV